MSKKERIYGWDFIRVFSCLLVIAYHFTQKQKMIVNWQPYWFDNYANGNLGMIAVTVFFILSGATNYYNHSSFSTGKDLLQYYKGRIRSLYPSFLLVFSYLFLRNALAFHKFFYMENASPATFLLSILGVDGYFITLGYPNYYMVGEWFLGAAIFLYAAYPLILFVFRKLSWIFVCITVIVNFILIMKFHQTPMTNPVLFLQSFYFGMLLAKYHDWIKRHAVICMISIPVSIFYLVYMFNPDVIPLQLQSLWASIFGVPIFLALFWIGGYVMRVPYLKGLILFFGGLSYQMFILHHLIIDFVGDVYASVVCGYKKESALLVLCVLMTVWFSYILKILVKHLFERKAKAA